MSTLVYNGVNFRVLHTEYIQDDLVLDSLDNFDPLFTRVLIEVTLEAMA